MIPFLPIVAIAGAAIGAAYFGSDAILKRHADFQPFGTPFSGMEHVPDGTWHCLVVLPRPMVGERPGKTEHVQVAIADYPNRGDNIITTCESISEGTLD